MNIYADVYDCFCNDRQTFQSVLDTLLGDKLINRGRDVGASKTGRLLHFQTSEQVIFLEKGAAERKAGIIGDVSMNEDRKISMSKQLCEFNRALRV